MLETLRNALKVQEIRKRLLYTFFILVIVRIGCQVPIPGTDSSVIKDLTEQFAGGAFSFFDAMTGGSFENMSLFALNITPYITASIIMQLLTIAIPSLEELQKDGEEGRKKIAEITRYMTVVLSLIESIAMAIGFGSQGLFGARASMSTAKYAGVITVAVITMTAGSALVMWLGETINERGVGNGISIVLLINIVARIPSDFASLFEKYVVNGSSVGARGLGAILIIVAVLVLVALVVILQGGERRIPVQYAKKIQGRKAVGGQSSNIPLKVNTAGVIPIIFAQSILQFPVVIARFVTGGTPEWTFYFTSSYWCKGGASLKYSIGFLVYIVMVIGFAYFYTSITFNPMEVADNMKKQGGFIPGIRPGKPTTEYLNTMLNYIVFIGAVGLLIVASIPILFSGITGQNLSFGGTSMIIIVGVVLETIKQIESMMVVRNYKGFLTE